jgi:D-sedoheptulose 7-phosphate isomerase
MGDLWTVSRHLSKFPTHEFPRASGDLFIAVIEVTMNWDGWLADYLTRYQRSIFVDEVRATLVTFHDLAVATRNRKRKLMFAGNGASASIASHGAVDFTKQGRVRSVDFNEPNLITAFANDYGFQAYLAKAVDFYADDGDAIVLLSVSGRSPNVVEAARYAKGRNIPVVSFTGSDSDNPLRAMSDVSFWVDSRAYNIVECTHMIWLTTVVDMLVGKAEYKVS